MDERERIQFFFGRRCGPYRREDRAVGRRTGGTMAARAAVLGGDEDLDSGSGKPEGDRGGDCCPGARGRKRNPV